MIRFHPGRRRLLSLALAILVTLNAGHDAEAAELMLVGRYNRFAFRPTEHETKYPVDLILKLLPEEDVASITDGQGYRIVRDPTERALYLKVRCQPEALGIVSVGPFTVRVNGAELQSPAWKVVFLPLLTKESGLTILCIPDPNDSGATMVNVEDQRFLKKREIEALVEVDIFKLPDGVVRVSVESSYSDERSASQVIFENHTGVDFILGPEYFKNLPEGYELPRLVIPSSPK